MPLRFRARYTDSATAAAENKKTEEAVRTIDNLGRIAIPKEMRQKLGIEPGDYMKVRIDEAAGAVVITKVITKEGSE